MIHLVVREPQPYQRTLCQALSDSFKGAFVAWFTEKCGPLVSKTGEDFSRRFVPDLGYKALYRELRSDPDAIVILGGWSSAIAHKTLLITERLRIPVFIWTDHPHPRQRNWAFDKSRKSYLRILSRRVAGFLACGHPTVRHLESLGITPEKITNFPYWVDVPTDWSPPKGCTGLQDQSGVPPVNHAQDARATFEGPYPPLRLIAVGRHVPVKAFEVAIEAVSLANKDASEPIATLELVGDGPERQSLEALAKSRGAAEGINFSGWIENDQVWKRVRDADALVIPSRFEPYGVVVLEAMANGRPVLASDQVIAALDRDDGKGAILFHPAGDPVPLAQQIKQLAKDRAALARASAAARAIAEQWPPTRAGQILQPLFDRATQHRSRRTSDEAPAVYEGIVNRPAQSTTDRS